tara:strand:- start:495 stop:701 length:207 start_codon:yes stop_codon:yes gene_type:complete
VVVPLGFEPRSEEPESSMMDRYTKGLLTGPTAIASSIQRFKKEWKNLLFVEKPRIPYSLIYHNPRDKR